MLEMRHLFVCAVALCCVGLAPEVAAAEYPSKPIRVVVPWPPGGVVDAVGRVLAEKLSADLGQTVTIDNRPGAAGNIGADLVAKAEPDGHTLLLTNSSLTMGAAISPNLPFDLRRDLEPIALTGIAPSILVVHPSLEVKSVSDLIALAKSKPGTLTYASSGTGTPAHFAAEMFSSSAGLNVIHVPYKGAGPMMNDQIAGHVSFSFSVAPAALPQIKAGRVRPLAITSAVRSALVPDIPTMQEAGINGYEASQWVGFFAPRNTPRPVVERLAASVNKVLAVKEVKASLAQQGVEADGASGPASFSTLVDTDLAKWRTLVREAKMIKAN